VSCCYAFLIPLAKAARSYLTEWPYKLLAC